MVVAHLKNFEWLAAAISGGSALRLMGMRARGLRPPDARRGSSRSVLEITPVVGVVDIRLGYQQRLRLPLLFNRLAVKIIDDLIEK